MEIVVEKMALIRENQNPKNTTLNLDIDWSVEYKDTDQRKIRYDIILKSKESWDLSFKIGGLLILNEFEDFIQKECSQILFHHACIILMNVISLTKNSNYELMNDVVSSTINL